MGGGEGSSDNMSDHWGEMEEKLSMQVVFSFNDAFMIPAHSL